MNMVTCDFAAGVRVDAAADIFYNFGNLQRVALFGALEQHMFRQMSNAVMGHILMARAHTHPNAQRHGMHPRHRIGHHAQPRGQFRHPDFAHRGVIV